MWSWTKKNWNGFKKIGLWIGNIITNFVLSIFYFTIFALFAIVIKQFSNPFATAAQNSNWTKRTELIHSLDDVRNE